MTYGFLTSAEREVTRIVDYYDMRAPSLGDDFLKDLHENIEHVMAFPKAFPTVTKRHRKCNLTKFPYCFVYSIHKSRILIVALHHHKQRPLSWKKLKIKK